ncbi:MAG: PilZ domain-containing protein [Lysinibacillus sp.]
MIFKRQEGFRYAFGEPLEAGVVILIEGKPLDVERTRIPCEILDISPRGLKISIGEDFNEHKNKVLQLEVSFILDATEIKGIGEIVWSKKFGSGYHYGITFFNQASVEDLIINELKTRRRKEILHAKVKS